jgi:hypothetical protein
LTERFLTFYNPYIWIILRNTGIIIVATDGGTTSLGEYKKEAIGDEKMMVGK